MIHGDFWFSNILLDYQDQYRLIDMRGQLDGVLTMNGDKYYDYGKMYQSILGYDLVLNGNELNIEYLEKMKERGGGFKKLTLISNHHKLQNYYKLECTYDTVDAMGANIINTSLEELSQIFKESLEQYLLENHKSLEENKCEILLCILSNYTPQCLVKVWVSAPVKEMGMIDGLPPDEFVSRFIKATQIAQVDVSRAVTHNKGIMNGVDAIVIATGNDFRAIEASVHSFASITGAYKGLSHAEINTQGEFVFELTLPLSLGTVGGLTKLHPLAAASLKILGNPKATELMQIVASVGLAQNFSAIRSLVTTGIQKGHMKLHLLNILKQLEATEDQINGAKAYFVDKIVSHKAVRDFLQFCPTNKSTLKH
jgi:hydroxymethylglutaryl-CoA reductase